MQMILVSSLQALASCSLQVQSDFRQAKFARSPVGQINYVPLVFGTSTGESKICLQQLRT